MSPGSNTVSYPAFTHIGLRKNPRKNLNQVTCPDRESNPGHLVSRLDVLTVTPQVCEEWLCFCRSVNCVISGASVQVEDLAENSSFAGFKFQLGLKRVRASPDEAMVKACGAIEAVAAVCPS
ncbi:hypothetical protein ANN_22744 [Periplaneta americana]|uniref:Uncharacterized protein n=1 Tax=Periplaneta americana TaxID=6978 RepID=A0ABQ8SKG1_PERAM|nr:hypothetical protein ANN_22744 [Periplaneta americana]